jgi:hypothetical protein
LACVSNGNCRRILVRERLLVVGFFPVRGRDHQSDCRDGREQRYASRSGDARRAEHEQGARVPDLRLVQERIAFDDHECGNRGPKAEADEPAAHATRW